MSQALQGVNVTGEDIDMGRGDHLRGTSNFIDGSGPIFSMYLEMATEEDKKMVEGWKADADGILIFTGLFSAAVASLISVSIQDIRPNPQDTSNFYLANIYQTLADPGSNISSSLPASPPPFSPPIYAVWVNTLLFLSLVISISCALLATLLQQWARRYLKVTQPRYSQHKRARIRAFFFEGVGKFLLPWAVEALPTLLHVSLFLFFAGISVFLWNVNLTIFKSVVSWIGVCSALYGCITFVPIIRHDSPYHTPLSLPASYIVAGTSFATFRILRWFIMFMAFCYPCLCFGPFSLDRLAEKTYRLFKSWEERHCELLLQGMQKTVERTALNSPSEIDTRAFLWTFDNLDEDHELERFFSGVPGFRSSKVVDDPLPALTGEQKWKLSTVLMGLLELTFSSDLLPEPVKDRRAIICAKVSDPAYIPKVSGVFDKILTRYRYSGPMSAEIVRVMSGWGNNRGNDTNLVATVCATVARVQQHDDSWFILASHELGVREPILREYAAHGDSLSLAILIHVARQQFGHFHERSWPSYELSKVLVETTSSINAQDTSSDLQYEFCALWNKIVLKAQKDTVRAMAWYILRQIRGVYTSLHQDTDSAPIHVFPSTGNSDDLSEPSSYPVCSVAGHIHDDSTSTTFARVVPHNKAAPAPASPSSPDAPSSTMPAPLHVGESPGDVPPLDNFHLSHQTNMEGVYIPATSPNPARVDVFVTSGMTIPHTTLATSTSAPLSSTSLSTAVALQHNSDLLTPSNPVLNSTLPTESHRSLIVTIAPRNPPWSTSASYLDTATEDNGSPKPGSHKENDALDTAPVNHAIHANTTTLDFLP